MLINPQDKSQTDIGDSREEGKHEDDAEKKPEEGKGLKKSDTANFGKEEKEEEGKGEEPESSERKETKKEEEDEEEGKQEPKKSMMDSFKADGKRLTPNAYVQRGRRRRNGRADATARTRRKSTLRC